MSKVRHYCEKSPTDPTYNAKWSGVSGAPHAPGKYCPEHPSEPLHKEAGAYYCPRCDDYVSPFERLSALDAADEFGKTTEEDCPPGYRMEVWYQRTKSGEVAEEWYVGEDGALSYSGVSLTPEEWNEKIREA